MVVRNIRRNGTGKAQNERGIEKKAERTGTDRQRLRKADEKAQDSEVAASPAEKSIKHALTAKRRLIIQPDTKKNPEEIKDIATFIKGPEQEIEQSRIRKRKKQRPIIVNRVLLSHGQKRRAEFGTGQSK